MQKRYESLQNLNGDNADPALLINKSFLIRLNDAPLKVFNKIEIF